MSTVVVYMHIYNTGLRNSKVYGGEGQPSHYLGQKCALHPCVVLDFNFLLHCNNI